MRVESVLIYEYVNPLKLSLAIEEARLKGGEVHDIYLRMGGRLVELEEAPVTTSKSVYSLNITKVEKPKKTRKK